MDSGAVVDVVGVSMVVVLIAISVLSVTSSLIVVVVGTACFPPVVVVAADVGGVAQATRSTVTSEKRRDSDFPNQRSVATR